MVLALTALHLVVCIFLILVVLLQTGRGADVAAAFGAASTQTAFGARGAATLLSKLTTGSAIIFMITSFTLALWAGRGSRSVVTDDAAQRQSAPAVPGPAPSNQTPPPAPPQ